MSFFSRLRGRIYPSLRAKWQHQQAMVLAKLHKHQAAIDAYTAVIVTAEAPADLRAMALYNRALVHHAVENQSEAMKDLNEVLAMDGAPEQVKIEARRKLVRMDRKTVRGTKNKPS